MVDKKFITQCLSGADGPCHVTFWPPDRLAIVLKLRTFNLNFQKQWGWGGPDSVTDILKHQSEAE